MNMKRMRGVYVVEFAIIGLCMFVLLFGVLELGRLYFTVNALNEVVRRGARLAVVCPVSHTNIRERAIFRSAESSESQIIRGLESADLSLTYLDEDGGTVSAPATTGFSEVRYVQVSITGFSFRLLIPGFGEGFTLPEFRATLPRESLGYDGATEEPTKC
ncbi:hypothetical protein D9M70_471550 [compost metagenome]